MAEKETINIVQLQIKEEDVIKKLTELKTVIDSTRKSTKELEAENKKLSEVGKQNSQAYKDNAVQIEKNKAQVKGLSTEYSNNQKILVSLNQDQNNNLKSINDLVARNKALRQERNNLDITTEKGQKRLKDLNAEIDKNDKLIKDNNDNLIKQKINIGNYSSALDGLPGPIGGAVTGFKALTKSALAFIATPIGALVASLVGLFKLFQAAVKNSQTSMDKLDAAGAAFSATFKVIIDRVSNFAEKIVAAFEDPKQAILDLWQIIKTNILNRIKGIGDTFIGLGKVIKNVFKLNFDEAGEAAKDMGKSLVQAFSGVKYDDIKSGLKSITDEIKTEAKEASNLKNQMLALEDREIAFIKRRDELNAKAREALSLSKNQQLSDEDRIKQLETYLSLLEEQKKEEIAIANERARISQEQVDQGNSTREELKANEELQAAALRLQAELYSQQGEAISQLSGLRKTLFNERMAQINATIAAERKAVEDEIALRQQADDLFNEIDSEQTDEFLKSLELNEQNKLELLNQSIFGQLEAERQKLEAQKQMEIEAAEAIGADTNLINKKYAKLETDLNKKTLDAKLDLASQAFGNLAQIFGENTKAAKAASAAQTTIETIKGAIQAFNAFTTVGGPIGMILGGIAAAAVTASGVKAVRDIYAVKSGLPGDSAGGGSSVPSVRVSGLSGGTSSASINDGGVVGRSMGMKSIKEDVKNGFSEALQENPLQPTLVVDEVTNKQMSNKYIADTATI